MDYAELFRVENAPSVIDVLSIDVDDACYETLKAVPFGDFEYKIVMVEHDFYRTPNLRDSEREHLRARGYELICSDVIHEPGRPFEDWWLKVEHFDKALISRIRSANELDIEIIRKFGHKNAIIRSHGFNGSYPQIETA